MVPLVCTGKQFFFPIVPLAKSNLYFRLRLCKAELKDDNDFVFSTLRSFSIWGDVAKSLMTSGVHLY